MAWRLGVVLLLVVAMSILTGCGGASGQRTQLLGALDDTHSDLAIARVVLEQHGAGRTFQTTTEVSLKYVRQHHAKVQRKVSTLAVTSTSLGRDHRRVSRVLAKSAEALAQADTAIRLGRPTGPAEQAITRSLKEISATRRELR